MMIITILLLNLIVNAMYFVKYNAKLRSVMYHELSEKLAKAKGIQDNNDNDIIRFPDEWNEMHTFSIRSHQLKVQNIGSKVNNDRLKHFILQSYIYEKCGSGQRRMHNGSETIEVSSKLQIFVLSNLNTLNKFL